MAKAILLFVGTDEGLVFFSNPGGVGRWLRVGHVLRGGAIHAIWPSPDNPLTLFAAAATMGLQRSDDGGQSWRQALEGEAHIVSGHPSAPDLLYLVADVQLYHSQDAGATWEPCSLNMVDARSLLVARADPRRLYLASDTGIRASDDGGASWAPYGASAPAPAQNLAEAPARPGHLYAAASQSLYQVQGSQEPWERLETPQLAPGGALAALAGKEPALLLALAEGGLGRSVDAASWTLVGSELGEVAVIAPASYHIDTAFAGGPAGQLAMSSDRGRTWQILKQGLPPIRSIAAARLA